MGRNIGLSLLVGLATLIVVPTLGVFSIGMVVGSILAIGGGLLRTLGMDFIQMSFWPGKEIPVAYSIPVTIVVAVFLNLLAYGSWKLLRRYHAFIR